MVCQREKRYKRLNFKSIEQDLRKFSQRKIKREKKATLAVILFVMPSKEAANIKKDSEEPAEGERESVETC